MAKTRRTKRNSSPRRPFPSANAAVLKEGDMIRTRGIRGRTVVKRIVEDGRRLKTVRVVQALAQLPEPQKGTPIFVGRVYTGAPRGKTYPAHGPRRFPRPASADAPTGFLGGLTKRVKKVLVGGADA